MPFWLWYLTECNRNIEYIFFYVYFQRLSKYETVYVFQKLKWFVFHLYHYSNHHHRHHHGHPHPHHHNHNHHLYRKDYHPHRYNPDYCFYSYFFSVCLSACVSIYFTYKIPLTVRIIQQYSVNSWLEGKH